MVTKKLNFFVDIMFTDSAKSAVNVEATAYALLTMAKLNKIDQDKGNDKDRATALNIVRWIAQQRNSKGGFVSTQVIPIPPFHYCSLLSSPSELLVMLAFDCT
jgi:hypothetical protein